MGSGSGQGFVESSLQTRLSAALTDDVRLTFNHVSTPPTKCDPLFAPPSGRRPQRTYQESHLLIVSTVKTPTREQTFIFALEIFIYTTRWHTTLFVSKADSTGCLKLLNLPSSNRSSPVRCVASVFIDWLIDQRERPGVPTVVSLFARAQNQYLFPGSESNAGKHILDDRQLVRWWCKTLDPIALKDNEKTSLESCVLPSKNINPRQGFLIVPGFDQHETTQFFPDMWRAGAIETRRWKYGHPLYNISPYPAAAPRSMVPRFPDDPKTRYVNELDAEIPDASSLHYTTSPSKRGDGRWKSVQTLETFWDMMAFRQECRSGRLVGFIWVVIQPIQVDDAHDSQDSCLTNLTALTNTQLSGSRSRSLSSFNKSPGSKASNCGVSTRSRRKRRQPLKGPIVPRQPRIKISDTARSTIAPPEFSPYYRWPVGSRGRVLLSQNHYDRMHELLIRLDFRSDAAAASSTSKWLDEVSSVSGFHDDWGLVVEGRVSTISAPRLAEQPLDQVIDLSGCIVRKKRKAGDLETIQAQVGGAQILEPNMLSGGLVRKKQKSAG